MFLFSQIFMSVSDLYAELPNHKNNGKIMFEKALCTFQVDYQ